MVVHGYVKEIETEAGAALRAAVGLGEARQDALAATLRDAAEFLDVQVNQRARTGVLVANDLPCGAVEPRERYRPQLGSLPSLASMLVWMALWECADRRDTVLAGWRLLHLGSLRGSRRSTVRYD